MIRPLLMTMLFLAAVCAVAVAATGAADQAIHGPVTYEVKERYGKLNEYRGTIAASDSLYLLRLQLGEKPAEMPDYLEFSVNGSTLVPDGQYPYRFIACFVKLQKETTYRLVLRDDAPSGFRRPPITPKNVILEIMLVPPGMTHLQGVFGLMNWDALKDYSGLFAKIRNPAAAALAMEAASLQLTPTARADAMRRLADLKERSAEEYLIRMFGDYRAPIDVRAEAVIAIGLLGDKQRIPLLMNGIIEPDEKISTAAARALSFYPEEDTRAPLTEVLMRLDTIRKPAVIRSIINGGWRPVTTVMSLAETEDAVVFSTAVGLLGEMRDPVATQYLLKLLAEPGKRDVRQIIMALGATKDPRAAEALLALAGDPAKRRGSEAELGEALAGLGEQRAAGPIADMIKQAADPFVQGRLMAAYRTLTGNDYQ